ncbi:MAG: rod shape-determining protein MreC [Kofleriaceae bacterium]
MTLRRRLIDWGLVALFLLVPALILRASLRRPGELTKVDQAVLRVSAPLQSGVAWVVRRVGSVWNGYVALVGVEDENRELRAENERLRRELATMGRRAFDVDALEELALLRKQTAADTIGARVVAQALSPAFRVVRLRIDRGAGEVEPGMPVVTSAGLVGKILTVYGRHADVLLLTDPRSSVAIVVKRTGGVGQLVGVGAPDRYAAKVEWLDRGSAPDDTATLQIGDELYTSGQGGAFPAGILVGRVAKVSTKDYSMFQEIEVTPAVAFARLRTVLVLLAPPPPPDPTAGKDKRSEPAFGVRPF